MIKSGHRRHVKAAAAMNTSAVKTIPNQKENREETRSSRPSLGTLFTGDMN